MWTIFKSLLNWLQLCFSFLFWFFGCTVYGILALWPGIKPSGGCLARISLNHWTFREVPLTVFNKVFLCIYRNKICWWVRLKTAPIYYLTVLEIRSPKINVSVKLYSSWRLLERIHSLASPCIRTSEQSSLESAVPFQAKRWGKFGWPGQGCRATEHRPFFIWKLQPLSWGPKWEPFIFQINFLLITLWQCKLYTIKSAILIQQVLSLFTELCNHP